MYILYMLLLLHIKIYFSVIWIFYMSIKFREELLMIRGSSVSRFLNNREIKDPQTNRYICRLYGFTRSKCWLASPQLPACRRLLFPLSASNKGNRRGLHAGNPAGKTSWGSFVTHSFLYNECVTNELQRTSAGRLSAGRRPRKSCDLHMTG